MKYGATDDRSNVALKMKHGLTVMLNEIKDKDGKPSYQMSTADPEDDKLNKQLCIMLRSF